MNVLAFDTCYSACSVAVRFAATTGEARVFSERQQLEAGHAEALMPMVERVMREAGMAFGALDRIILTHGPGTFTGVRTGVAAARGLALATGAPIIALSSLWAIGVSAIGGIDRGGDEHAVLVAMDARKEQFHVQVIDYDERELTEPLLLDAAGAAALCPGHTLLAVGTGASQVAAAGQSIGRLILTDLDDRTARVHYQPYAVALLRAADRTPCLGPLLPLYLRPPDVKSQADKSLPWSP